jgi:hypothetical protein
MTGLLVELALLVVIVVAGLVAVDVASTPTPTRGQCLLVRRILLPDICNNICSPPFDCTRTTRSYLLFFTQSATCDDAVICPSAPPR